MIYSIEQIKTMRTKLSNEGKWSYSEYHAWVRWGDPEPPPCYEVDGPDFSLDAHIDALDSEDDAAFIAGAPAIVDHLLAKIEKQSSELDACWDVIGNQFGSMAGSMVTSAEKRLKDES